MSSSIEIRVGILLNERYRLDAELGRGGMGVVYRAHDTLLERDVAIKLLSDSALGTEGRARLLHEARAAASLNHPNIGAVHDAGEADVPWQADPAPFIVMELVEGESLYNLKAAGDRRLEALDEIVSIARQICAALEHAHAHGIIHRDLKPENVLLAPDGTAKLTDFGLARSVASRMTSEGTIVGTAYYLAPEQALGQQIDNRADLYSLGVLLYELTTGLLPFTADDPLAVISQHLHAPVVPPRAKNPKIPPALDNLILRMMSKEPGDRPASAAEVLGALAQPGILDRDIIPAEELSVLERIERGRMVGRERELAQARTLWKKVVFSEGQMLLISGEPGVGKSRLVQELVTQVQVSGGQALVGVCYAEGGAPYAPFAQVLRRAFHSGFCDDLGLSDFVLADLLTLAPALRRRFPEVAPNPPLDPQSEQQRLFENVVAFCAALSERAPLLLVLEDAHWADSSTLSLLRHLARRTRRQPVLLAATYREVELDGTRPFQEVLLDLNRERLATRLELSRLGREESRDMLAVLFDEEITPEFLDGIFRETEGNPFFIEEVCKALVESGELYFADGRWHRPSMDQLEIPQSVRAAIQSRIGKLPAEAQEILRLAAILGREFDFETLAEASALPKAGEVGEERLIDALESAEGAQLIEEISAEGGVTFAFTNALIPATLVEGVRTLRRRRLHRRAAAAVATLRPDDLEALAHHYGEAGDDAQALTYYTRAGERASAAYANQEAKNHFLAALDLVESYAGRAHLLSELGEVHVRMGHHEEAIETWQEGIDLYKSLGDQDGVARLYAQVARAAWLAGPPPRSLALCREGMEAIAGAPDSLGQADLLHETARACLFNGLPDEADVLCRRALEIAERLGAVQVQAEALTTLAIVPGRPAAEAVSALTQVVELVEAAGLLVQAARAHQNLGAILCFNAGDLDASRQHSLRATELFQQVGGVSWVLYCASGAAIVALYQGAIPVAETELLALRASLDAAYDAGVAVTVLQTAEALLQRYRGELAEAAERLRAHQAETRDAGDLHYLSIVDNTLAGVLGEIGEEEEAEAALREAIELGDRGAVVGGVWPRCILSVIRSRQREAQAARSLISEGREKATELGDRAWDAVWLPWARAHLAAVEGNWSDALKAFDATVDGFARMGMRWYRAHTLREWADAHLSRGEAGDRERARELLREATAEFESMGAPICASQVQDRLEQLEGHL